MTYISSASLSAGLRVSNMQIQTDYTKVQNEISTQKKDDIGLSLGAATGSALSMQGEIDKLNTFTDTNNIAGTRLSSTSNVLSTLVSAGQTMLQTLTQSTGVGSTSTLQGSAANALGTLVSSMNTTVGGKYIFGGINTTQQPVSTYTSGSSAQSAAATAFQSYLTANGVTASTITGTQMQSFLDNQYNALFSDSSWQANWSSASSQTIQSNISSSQTISTSVSANDSSVRNLTQGYAMLTDFASAGLSSDAQAALTSTAAKLVSSGVNSMTNVASGVGVSQNAIDAANTSISAQVDVLTSNVGDLEGVDSAALSVKVTQLQTQLQASYELTSKLGQLSLVNYLST